MKTLDEIAIKYRTDKDSFHHGYCNIYDEYFTSRRLDNLNFLELGLGNIYSKNLEGESLLMWKEYFPNANIVGIDIEDKKFLEQDRIKVYQGNQIDSAFLNEVCSKHNFDIIIDDCSHINLYTIRTFEILFPKLNQGGIYCIEDTVTSYWEGWRGYKDVNATEAPTLMNYFKRILDVVNMKKRHNFPHPILYNYPDWLNEITSIHFHNSQIIIKK
jgi:hypothetical protein